MTETMTVDVAKRPVFFQQSHATIKIRHKFGDIFFCLNEKVAKLSTIDAHCVGMAIQKSLRHLEDDEIYLIKVNGEPIELSREQAEKVSVGLLRKACQADDFQRSIKR